MKQIIFLLIFLLITFTNAKKIENFNDKNISRHSVLTDKMKKFKAEKKQNDKEAKKLEEDGFCPCSIQQP